MTIGTDGSVRKQSAWNDSVYAYVATPTDAWVVSEDGTVEDIHAEGRRELERRTRNTHWLSVLRAAMEPDAVVMSIGAANLLGGSQSIDRVVVSHDGTTCVVGIEPQTGRIKSIDFTGRGLDHRFGTWTCVFTAYLTVDGIVAPVAWDVYSSGVRESGRSGVRTTINPERSALGFIRPGE